MTARTWLFAALGRAEKSWTGGLCLLCQIENPWTADRYEGDL